MSFTSFLLRSAFERGDNKRDAGLETPEDIRRYDDIAYGGDARWQVLDVYRPKNETGKLPVIVSVHGGGWVYGDKERYQYYCMSLAQHGFAVVNYTYRLAPKFKFPASLEDTNLVFRWVLTHGGEYGFDTERVFAVGDSAGAHMLGLYSCICTNPDFAAAFPFQPPEGFAPAGVALNCGVYEIKTDGRKDLTARLMADYLPNRGSPEELEKISVLRHVTTAFPPSFVMTASKDFLREAAPAMVERLEALGVPVTYRLYGDEQNPLAHVFHCDVRSEAAKRCNSEECEFFRELYAAGRAANG